MGQRKLGLADARLAREDDGLGLEGLLRDRLPAEVLEVVQLEAALELLRRQRSLGLLDATPELDHLAEVLLVELLISSTSLDGVLDGFQVIALALTMEDSRYAYMKRILAGC